jgi:hypothetical protein
MIDAEGLRTAIATAIDAGREPIGDPPPGKPIGDPPPDDEDDEDEDDE